MKAAVFVVKLRVKLVDVFQVNRVIKLDKTG